MYWEKLTQDGRHFCRWDLCTDRKTIKASCTAYRLSDGGYDPAVSWTRYGEEVTPRLVNWIKYGERTRQRII